MPSDMIDEEILSQILERIYSGDEDAFRELYNVCASHMYRFALSVVKYSYLAEEAVQEAFLSIILYSGNKRVRKAKSWLFTVVKNCCIKALKDEHFSRKDDIDLYKDKLFSADQTESIETPLNEIEAVRVLDDNELRIIILCKIEGLTIPECAKILGISRVRARSVYDYAIKKLKKFYREKEGQYE